MHRVVAETVPVSDPFATRACAVLVPTRGAAEALRRTLEGLRQVGTPAFVLPELLTRAELYARLHARLSGAPPMLSSFEREVLFRRAARSAVGAGAPVPFRLRPGLVIEILAFYDELRRRDRTLERFDRLMTDSLAPSADIDRGAERMLRQTQFLSGAFVEFERLTAASGGLDEHALRDLLMADPGPPAFRHIIVTVPDQAADPLGLWAADYDLLARVPGLERLDVVTTENILATGFHQRLHDLLPGIHEERRNPTSEVPVLIAPTAAEGAEPVDWFVCRDREEELAEIARRVKPRGTSCRHAVVFQRPLPYLYLARYVLRDAGLTYSALDALPLAGEPVAAALDLVLTFALAEGNRASVVELMGSPLWRFESARGAAVTRDDVAALDRWLREIRYLGGWDRLGTLNVAVDASSAEAGGRATRARRAVPALQAAAAAAEALRGLTHGETASIQIQTLIDFVHAHERLPDPEDPVASRHHRARAAILGALDALARAHLRHDDQPIPLVELVGAVRRWIEGQTFAPGPVEPTSHGGGDSGALTFLDVSAAAYADSDEVTLVGLVETDWPDRSRRSIFYPPSLLTQLGWPYERDRLTAARARFLDLVRLARSRVSLSTLTLEDDAIVTTSPFLEEVATMGLAVERVATPPPVRIFEHEALSEEPVAGGALSGPASEWLRLRLSRSPADRPEFRGWAGPRDPAVYAVSHVERYLECPFKYFAASVLRLQEERDEESALTPQERGQLLHEVFETFFASWASAGRRGITGDNLGDALEMFTEVAESRLARLSESDRALERTYLLGSAVARGLAERAFAVEIEQGVDAVERLLEYPLEGEFEFTGDEGRRRLRLRAKVDRIDLLADGSLRIIDYKLGRAPKSSRALQLPIYGICAAQHLSATGGTPRTVSRAGYVAFREKHAFSALGGSSTLDEALNDGQRRFLKTVAGIERGEFPVNPDEPFLCSRCGYALVCRKDYVGDD